MPEVAAAIAFIRTANVPANAQALRNPVADLLGENPVSAAVEQTLAQVAAGTPLARQYRQAMILILCALKPVRPAQAQQVVAQYADPNLSATLGTMLTDVQRIYAAQKLTQPLQQLQTNPGLFLAANRISMGGTGPSASVAYEFSWKGSQRRFVMQPVGGAADTLHVAFQGFKIGVTKFTMIQTTLGQIQGAVVLGTMGLTTQLSGCSIFYSVNGGNLVVAHVWPDVPAAVNTNLPTALARQNALSPGVLLALRLAHQGVLSNALAGGTIGLFGMVNTQADTGLRLVGPRNMRMHGYLDTLGHGYFIAVQVNGSWELYGQQNDANVPTAAVSSFQRIYP
jgi:hypothetical protein